MIKSPCVGAELCRSVIFTGRPEFQAKISEIDQTNLIEYSRLTEPTKRVLDADEMMIDRTRQSGKAKYIVDLARIERVRMSCLKRDNGIAPTIVPYPVAFGRISSPESSDGNI
jgi:hypothetical protein